MKTRKHFQKGLANVCGNTIHSVEAKRVPTNDPVLKQYAPNHKRFDVIFFRPGSKIEFARWTWDHNPPTRRNRYVTLNGYRYRITWID